MRGSEIAGRVATVNVSGRHTPFPRDAIRAWRFQKFNAPSPPIDMTQVEAAGQQGFDEDELPTTVAVRGRPTPTLLPPCSAAATAAAAAVFGLAPVRPELDSTPDADTLPPPTYR
jgi:hypothetical protein